MENTTCWKYILAACAKKVTGFTTRKSVCKSLGINKYACNGKRAKTMTRLERKRDKYPVNTIANFTCKIIKIELARTIPLVCYQISNNVF